MRAVGPATCRSASAASSARMELRGTSCVTRPNGGGLERSKPVPNGPTAGARLIGTICAIVADSLDRTRTSPFDSRMDSRIGPTSARRTGAGVEKVMRRSGISLSSTVRPMRAASDRMTSASGAPAKLTLTLGGCGWALDCAGSRVAIIPTTSAAVRRVAPTRGRAAGRRDGIGGVECAIMDWREERCRVGPSARCRAGARAEG